MSTHKKIDRICVAAIILSVVLIVLFLVWKARDITAVMGGAAGSNMFTANDLDADWDISPATRIELSDEGSVINGSGAYVYDGNVYIAYAGCYVLSGELKNGSVVIDADKTDKIWILLDGVTIRCEEDAALRVEQAEKVFLTLKEGTENVLSSGEQYSEEAIEAGVDGTIYARDDLTINGTGFLIVNGAYHHGIVCNDDMVITGGNIVIEAAQDGIHANDSVRIRDAVLSVSAGDDGITVSNEEETAFFYMESGNVTIPDSYEGIEAVDITIAGGELDIMSTDDGMNASGRGENSVIRVTGGDIRIMNSSGRDADGLDSNGSIYIEGGKVFISVSSEGGNYALDCGSENGGECVVSGGTVIACGSSGMAEGFGQDSPQGFLMYRGTSAAAGTKLRLEDADGKELLSEEIPYGFSSVVLSTPAMKIGDTCTISIGEVQEQITIDNTSMSGFVPAGMFGGGMKNGRGPFGEGGQEFSDKPDRPEGQMELPGKGDFPEGQMELPDKGDFPEGEIELPDKMEPPSEGEGFFDNMNPRDNERRQNKQEMQEESGKTHEPGTERMHDNGMHRREQSFGEIDRNDHIPSSGISNDVWVLIGISAIVLLFGLFLAIKIKH